MQKWKLSGANMLKRKLNTKVPQKSKLKAQNIDLSYISLHFQKWVDILVDHSIISYIEKSSWTFNVYIKNSMQSFWIF